MTVSRPVSPINQVAHTIVRALQVVPSNEIPKTTLRRLVRHALHCTRAEYETGFSRAIAAKWIWREAAESRADGCAAVKLLEAGKLAGVWDCYSPYRETDASA